MSETTGDVDPKPNWLTVFAFSWVLVLIGIVGALLVSVFTFEGKYADTVATCAAPVILITALGLFTMMGYLAFDRIRDEFRK
jgi:hypothetical protein